MTHRLFVLIFIKLVFLNFLFAGNIKEAPVSINVIDLKCEYAANPIGIDIQNPQFSWRLASKMRGVFQTAYQVLVSDSVGQLDKGIGNVWNSGKIISGNSCGVVYSGKELLSRKRYFWKIKIWDSNQKESNWSETAFFEMGLMQQKDWVGNWIGYPGGWFGRNLYFAKTFNCEKEVAQARVYISGIGYYELHLNGKKVGNHVLDPATSNYNKRVYYVTYDITDFLLKQNRFGVIVGAGWYGIPKLRFQAEITYSDGSRDIIPGTSDWGITVGPSITSSIYDGEEYDARLEKGGWDKSIGDTTQSSRTNSWLVAKYIDDPGGLMVAQKIEPICIVDTILAKAITQPVPGVYVINYGQNLAGWASLKVQGERGIKVTMKYAENLLQDGTVNQDNLYTAAAMDSYTLKGGGLEHWEPAFTYHGFQYIQVENYPGELKSDDIVAKVVRSNTNTAGKFQCSNDLLNIIHQVVRSTEASNQHSIPTDCPQRSERNGWLNDLTVRIDQALYNFDLARFYSKFIDDVADNQDGEGKIADTAPYVWGNRPADPVCASYLLLALKSYEFYGNTQIIKEHFNGLKAWVDYLNSRTENGIVNYSYYGDWSPPIEFGKDGGAVSKNTPGLYISSGYLYYCSRILSQMAGILKIEADKIKYENLSATIKDAINKNYWDEKSGGYGSNNQACNSFALFIGIVDKEKIARVVENLVNDVKNHDYHLTTGNLCTKYVIEMLTEYGYTDIAFKIATQETYPSWGYMLANGATTLWERWENAAGFAMNSHNHPMMGSIDSWFYKYLLGILPDVSHPGFEKFTIKPYIINELSFAEGEYNSVKGLIKSAWKKKAGFIYMDITIPENSTATVYIPTKNAKSITEGNRKIDKIKELKFLKTEGVYAAFEIGSGTYNFKSEW
jgi:alpha-L-rhamnosidase